MMGKKRDRLIAVAIATVGAASPTLFMLKLLAANNNQGELFDTVTGAWNLAYAFQVCAVIFVPSFVVIFAITMLIRGAKDELS